MTTNFDPKRANPYVGNLTVKIVVDERLVAIIDSQHIVDCFFVEDIFSFCITGKLIFVDEYGLLEKGPFTGNEMISLVYGAGEETREIIFHLWKIKNIIQAGVTNATAESVIEAVFVDSSFYGMMVPKYSRSFEAGMTYTAVVNHILRNMVGWTAGDINIEPSKNALADNWAMPYWSGAECIKWLLRRAVGFNSNTSGYLCYNNTKESWKVNCYTLNYLFGELNTIDNQDYVFEGGNEDTQNKIFEWGMKGIDKSAMKSVRGGKWRGYNSTQKKLVEKEWSYSSGVASTVLLGKKSIVPNISDTSSVMRQTGEATEANVQNALYDEWVKDYSLQNLYHVIVQGNEKRYAGHQIQIRWPSVDRETELWQKQLEGRYLVKSITHSFVGKGRSNINYMQRMVLMKNAFQDSNSQRLLTATKKNLTGGVRRKFVLDI